MKTEGLGFPIEKHLVRALPGLVGTLAVAGLDRLETLSARSLGIVVTDRGTSWVRTIEIGSKLFYVKTYDYPTTRARLRGIGRNTWLARSRALREWCALEWLRGHDFPAPRPVAVAERRRLGVLDRAVLVTEAWPGAPMDGVLPELEPSAVGEVLRSLRHTVESLHRAGFRDRNLDLRNLLVGRLQDGTWQIAKIDSPRFKLRRPGSTSDRLARDDLARLRASLAAIGLSLPSES